MSKHGTDMSVCEIRVAIMAMGWNCCQRRARRLPRTTASNVQRTWSTLIDTSPSVSWFQVVVPMPRVHEGRVRQSDVCVMSIEFTSVPVML